MLKDGILVLIGGGIGAAVRELLMLGVANLPGGFPMPIFIANMTAALLIGVLSALPIELPIPGMSADNAAWYIFLGWFLLAAGSAMPQKSAAAAS